MPLYNRKPFPLADRPTDLKPQEHVFQVRFTKEIFRDYGYCSLSIFLKIGSCYLMDFVVELYC